MCQVIINIILKWKKTCIFKINFQCHIYLPSRENKIDVKQFPSQFLCFAEKSVKI